MNNMQMQTNCKGQDNNRILVVEDIELNQHLARSIIESWGFEVHIAVNGREAVKMVGENNYDLVLMDIQMPEMDGIEATRQIRQMANAAKASIPIVALTANVLKGDSEQYLAAGMNDCLAKPVDESRLFRIVSKNINKQMKPVVTIAKETPEPAAPQGKLYDLTMMQTISGGDESFIKRMMQLFIDTMPVSIQEIQKELQQQNWEGVGKLAHKMKSTIDSMGIELLRQDIRTVEQYGKKSESTEAIPALIDRVVDILEQCMAQVKQDFQL